MARIGRPPKDHPLGHPMSRADAERRRERSQRPAESVSPTKRLPYGTPQPKADSRWDAKVQSYWKSLAMSDFALVAQPAQWMYAYVAMEVLDRMYRFGFTAGMVKEFHQMAMNLGLPRFDILDDDDPAFADLLSDADEAEAEQAVTDIRSKLKVVK